MPSEAILERAAAAKDMLEQRYAAIKAEQEAKREQMQRLEEQMERLGLDEEKRNMMREELRRSQSQARRAARKKMSVDDFVMLRIIGKGAFGQVRLVKLKSTGEVFAMKTMVKSAMVLKNQVSHVRAERNILAKAEGV